MEAPMARILTFVLAALLLLAPRPGMADTPFGSDAHLALGAFRGMVEEHVLGVRRTLRVVAASSEARAGGWESVRPLLDRLSEDLPTDATTWYARPDGSYFATVSEALTGETLKDRAYFPRLMSGQEVLGDLVISKTTGHRSVIVAVPVMAEGRAVGAVGVSLRVRLLSELVNRHLALPSGEYFYALEQDTRIVLHRYADRMFKTPADVGDEALGREFHRILTGDRGSFSYTLHGEQIASIFERSPTLGWYFFIARKVPPTGSGGS